MLQYVNHNHNDDLFFGGGGVGGWGGWGGGEIVLCQHFNP